MANKMEQSFCSVLFVFRNRVNRTHPKLYPITDISRIYTFYLFISLYSFSHTMGKKKKLTEKSCGITGRTGLVSEISVTIKK